ncbi:PKD domain-containing protein [Planctobacterium marinum]|uniref:Chitinase n=1 Tax=Planctobacterium marinum TaxID=1631968 RepID=A0AA48HND5_9ALTE|nr:hypothetical protein MACH26_22030 [Planctobacterium marinum]
MKLIPYISALLLLSACGGSGGGSTSTPPVQNPPPVTPVSLSIEGDTEVSTQQSVALIAMLDTDGASYSYSWQQVSGDPINLLTTDSQVLSFDAPAAGEYGFQVNVSDATGATLFSETQTLTVSAEEASATVRLDHAVSETAKVSLRADALPEQSITSISWQQIAGVNVPQSNFSESSDENFLFFDAPSVSSDQLLQFRATMTLDNGENISDDVYVLVKNVTSSEDGFFPDSAGRIITTEMRPYNANSPYAQALENCVYNNTVSNSCRFSTLPLIGQETLNPGIDDIMDRVYVSHQWMGDRLKDYLENSVAAEDMLALFRGVTAIVISYEVRPSFYWVATGAIYLDANNFWVTPQERDTLNDQPDFRSAFGNDLQFFMPWRYVKDGESYLSRANYPQSQRLSRSFADVEADITWLLYHELAHANDFFPPDRWASIPLSSDPISYFNLMPADSSSFSQLYPLNSEELRALAQVSFAGETATTAQRNTTDQQAADLFSQDNAAMYYSYLTVREDYATLFERFMMAYRFGAEADTAVMKVVSDNPDLLVTWGQRSRISDNKLTSRTRQVVRNIYPSIDVDAIQPTLPEAKLMVSGASWQENLMLPGERAGKSSGMVDAKDPLSQGVMPDYMLHYQHQGRPELKSKD